MAITSFIEISCPQAPVAVESHTMGTSLHRYLDIKMHQAIHARCYDEIRVVGSYCRGNASEIFQGEKTDKEFNWQRPTASVKDNTLEIQCFPGYDHVEHYAELITTFLKLQESKGNYSLTPPLRVTYVPSSCSDTQMALRASNLQDLPEGIDTVVLGLVHRLERLTGSGAWQGSKNGCFGWILKRFNQRLVAFVGCRPSFWGDISGEIVHFLASRKTVSEVIYFGKLGSVKKGTRPNTYLATGSRSYMHNRLLEWENILEPSVAHLAADCTLVGNHITLGSVLHETKTWLASLPKSADFVDPEIGTMAQAAIRSGIRFGYLHIISDNVAEKYTEDLSNEREASVLDGRMRLYDVVQEVLEHHLSRDVLHASTGGVGIVL